eukprot:4814276-Alexandrium_andersonii.AAC.1
METVRTQHTREHHTRTSAQIDQRPTRIKRGASCHLKQRLTRSCRARGFAGGAVGNPARKGH